MPSDIESNVYNLDYVRPPEIVENVSLLNRDKYNKKILIGITLLYTLILSLNIYFMNNDNSCVTQTTNILIQLYDFLFVDAMYGITLLLLLPVILCIIDLDNELERELFTIIAALRFLFLLSWTSFGSYIFWFMVDNSKCNDNIYYYVVISIIIRYVICILCVFIL